MAKVELVSKGNTPQFENNIPKSVNFQSIEKLEAHATPELLVDATSGVFEGMELLQKFTNKSSYDTRFIWINMQTNSIHMSQYMTKDRRHKEASLAEVTSILEDLPSKSKSNVPIHKTLCLTINFKRGGGIDLIFKTVDDKNEWCAVLRKIINNNLMNEQIPQ